MGEAHITESLTSIPAPPTIYEIRVREFIGSSFLTIVNDGNAIVKELMVNTDALDAFCRKWVATHDKP
jgi:hypothetical protein